MGFTKTKRKPNEYMIKARVKNRGEDRRKQELFYGNRAQAEARYFAIKAELRGERPKVDTFGQILDAYNQSRGGVKDSQATIFNQLKKDLGQTEIRELGDAIRRYYGILQSIPSQKTGRRLSPAALNRSRTMVAAALNLAVKTRDIVDSPLNEAIWPKAKEVPRDRFLGYMDVLRLLNVIEVEAPHLLPIVRYALLVPCRKAELVAMTRDDLDLFHNAIRVNNGTTKNEDGAWKPIPPSMVAYFRSTPPESPFLFYKKVGKRFRPLGDFKRSWTRCLRVAGLKNFHFHDTRHISATNMIDAGTPERVVMDVAGWRTNMLSTYYKSSSKRALEFVKFGPGGSKFGTTTEPTREINGQGEAEKAVL